MEIPAFPGEDEEGTTDEIPQREHCHPATEKARHNFWKLNTPTDKQSKKGLETQEKKEEIGPNSDSQPKDPSKTHENSDNACERYGVSILILQGDLWQS